MRNRVARVAALAASAFVTIVVAGVMVANIGLPLGMLASLWLGSMAFSIKRNMEGARGGSETGQ